MTGHIITLAASKKLYLNVSPTQILQHLARHPIEVKDWIQNDNGISCFPVDPVIRSESSGGFLCHRGQCPLTNLCFSDSWFRHSRGLIPWQIEFFRLKLSFSSDKEPEEVGSQTDCFSKFSDSRSPKVGEATLVQEATAYVPVTLRESSVSSPSKRDPASKFWVMKCSHSNFFRMMLRRK